MAGREDTIRKLLEFGVLPTPEVVEKAERRGIDNVVVEIKRQETTKDRGGSYLVATIAEEKKAKETVTAADVLKANSEKYENMRKFFLGKLDAVSIKNVEGSHGKIGVVGMVREKTGDGFILEDSTGEIEVVSEAGVELDDVIGVDGLVREKRLVAARILYPEMPINRDVAILETKILLSPQETDRAEGAEAIITPGGVIIHGKRIGGLPNPGWVRLEKGGKSATVLVFRPNREVPREEVLGWLKKRYIKTGEGLMPQEARVITEYPDILWVVSEKESWTENHKGTTLIMLGNAKKASIDFSTRGVEII